MEYAVFVIGIIALIVSVVISGKIAERNENELKAIRMEIEANVESRIKDYFDTTIADIRSFFQGKVDYIEEKLVLLSTRKENIHSDWEGVDRNLDDAVDRIDDAENNIEDHEHRLNEAVDRLDDVEYLVYDAKEKIIQIKNTIDIESHNSQWVKEDYVTYLENDSSVLKHIESTGYDINSVVIFMAYMLQDLKDKVYGKKIITHEEPKTKTSTRRKKVSVSRDTNDTVTGSETSKV